MLGASKVCHDLLSVFNVYTPDLSFSQLYTHDMIEISVVVKGFGIHQISNQVIPCKEGDAYVVLADIPHGYFVNNENDTLIVRRLYFDVRDWFDADVCNPESRRFCYGIFSDNSVSSYAMLNAKTQNTV